VISNSSSDSGSRRRFSAYNIVVCVLNARWDLFVIFLIILAHYISWASSAVS
jgi:hypothetical protein